MVVISSSFSAPDEGVLQHTSSVKLHINDQELGTGNLYVTEHNVVWGGGVLTSGEEAPTITLLYPNISLHATQRQPEPAVYMMLNYDLRVPGLPVVEPSSNDDDEDDEFVGLDDTPITQLRFYPPSESDLDPIYSALSQGQALHPDPQDVEGDDEDYMDGEELDEGDEQFEDAEESAAQPEEAAARLRTLRLNHNGTHNHDENYEDAEIGEE